MNILHILCGLLAWFAVAVIVGVAIAAFITHGKGRWVIALGCLTLAAPASAQALAPATALVVGSSLDLFSTLHALHTVPGAHEANPILARGGTAGLVVTKAATTAFAVWCVRRLTRTGHPILARVLGYAGGAVLAGIAVRNARL